MKRGTFKKRRCKLKRKSKSEITKIQDKIWELCKQITRKKYGAICYTCGKTGLIGSNWHTGHLWAKASLGAYLKYDLRVLRPQCYRCNIHLGGNSAEFYRKMVQENSQEYMDKLHSERNITVNAYDWYEKLLEDYKKM